MFGWIKFVQNMEGIGPNHLHRYTMSCIIAMLSIHCTIYQESYKSFSILWSWWKTIYETCFVETNVHKLNGRKNWWFYKVRFHFSPEKGVHWMWHLRMFNLKKLKLWKENLGIEYINCKENFRCHQNRISWQIFSY